MKQRIKILVLLFLATSATFGARAQNQYEAWKGMSGTYRVYSVDKKDGKYVYYYNYELPVYEVQVNENADVALFTISINQEGKTAKSNYMIDEPGYPVTMVNGMKQHPKVKYLKGSMAQKGKRRIIALDGAIVELENYKSSTDYLIRRIMKKGKLNKLKGIREAVKTEMKMKNEKWEQRVADYLSKELASQPAKVSAWKSANPAYEKQLAKDRETWKGLLNWSKEEQRKIDNSMVTITNKLSYPVYYKTKSGASFKIRAGSFERVDCSLSTLYRCNSSGGDMTLLLEPSEYCGKSYFIK
jgi:hypothetical protein